MLAIGTLAKRTGTKVQTIRYYEQIGLMPEPGRTEGGQRRYGDAELDRLSFIRHSRQQSNFATSRRGWCGSKPSALNCSA
ncbi:transcriptional regulator, MerR family protein [Sulfitobacter sp. EE-36]|nr:transcriptional regulator, MerR family protein [Sulfitobacter sp. EE-36]